MLPPLPLSIHTRHHPAFAGSRIVFTDPILDRVRFGHSFFTSFFPLGLGYITVILRAKPHKHVHTYRYQYRGCSSNHRLYGKCRKAFGFLPNTAGVAKQTVNLGLAWLGMTATKFGIPLTIGMRAG